MCVGILKDFCCGFGEVMVVLVVLMDMVIVL